MSGNGSTLTTPGQFLHAFGYPRSDSADFANAVSATPPTPVFPGKLWWNTNDGQLYVWYVDPNSAQWVAIQAAQGGAAPFQVGPGLSLNVGTSPPTIDVVTPYLPLTGGTLAGAGNLAIRGGLIVGATGATPAAGNVTLNQNTVLPVATYGGSGFRVVGADGQVAGLVAETYGASPPILAGRNSAGTAAGQGAVTANSVLLRLQGVGYAGSAVYGGGATIDSYAAENWTTTSIGSGLRFYSTPVTTNVSAVSMTVQAGVGIGTAAVPGANGSLVLNANTVAPPALAAGQPTSVWAVGANAANAGMSIDARGAGNAPIILGRQARGTLGAATATQGSDPLLSLQGNGYDGTAFAQSAWVNFYAIEPWTPSAHGSNIQLFTTLIGTTTSVLSLQLQGNTATFSGSVFAGGSFYSVATGVLGFGSNIGAPGAPSTNSYYYGDNTNTFVHLGSGNGSFSVQNGSGTTVVTMTGTGQLTLGSGISCKAGTNGANDGHIFNLYYGPSGPTHLWIDLSDLGAINVTPCDVRLKKNLEPPSVDALAAINAVELKQFDWLANDLVPEHHEDIGFIAQQLVDVIPNAVTIHEDPEQMASVQLTPIVAHLIGAVQQLSAEVASLKAQLEAR